MASAEEARPKEGAITMKTLVRAHQKVSGTGQAPPGDRYRLTPSTFRRDGDVEQLI